MPESIQLDKWSMFRQTPLYEIDGDLTFGLRRVTVLPANDDRMLDVVQAMESRLDLLSNDLYGTPHLWWAIAELNALVDPMTEVKIGSQLRVPTKARLMALLST